jgi:hypothetical protein
MTIAPCRPVSGSVNPTRKSRSRSLPAPNRKTLTRAAVLAASSYHH